jgi:hypothetical protein
MLVLNVRRTLCAHAAIAIMKQRHACCLQGGFTLISRCGCTSAAFRVCIRARVQGPYWLRCNTAQDMWTLDTRRHAGCSALANSPPDGEQLNTPLSNLCERLAHAHWRTGTYVRMHALLGLCAFNSRLFNSATIPWATAFRKNWKGTDHAIEMLCLFLER